MKSFTLQRCATAVAASLVLGGLTLVAAPAAHAAPVTIDIVTFNDFHGRLEAGTGIPGAAVLAGAIDAARAANPNTLVASAGDNIGASTFTSFIQQDKPTIDVLNEIKPDASSLGNHEFDTGRSDLDSRVLPTTGFPYLAANLYDKASGKRAYPAYTVSDVSGIKVGFIGAVTEALPSLVPPGAVSSLDVKSIVTEVNQVATDLTDGSAANGEADVLVLLLHEGATSPNPAALTDGSDFAKVLAGIDTDIDAVVSGHSHQLYNHSVSVPGWPAGLKRPVLQAEDYGTTVGRITISVDPATKGITALGSTVTPLLNPDGSAKFPKNPAVDKIVKDAVAVANVKGAVSVGSISTSLRKARQSSGEDNRGGESTIGNLIADTQLAAAKDAGAQIALMNPGGIRDDLNYSSTGATDPDGNVTYREAANVQPFANTLIASDLTGAQLKNVLEQQWQPAGSSRPFLKLGVSTGFAYTYDPSAAKGSRITTMTLNGTPVDPSGTYRVVANSFLAAGGDNFTTLGAGTNRKDTGRVDLAAFVDYLATHPRISPDLAQRAVGVIVSPADADGYNGGDTVQLKLSSLLFSGGEKAASTVEVLFDGIPVTSAAIDPTIVDTTDEVGRATVNVVIPAGRAPGAHTLTVSVPATGTRADVPLTTSFKTALTVDALSEMNYSALGGISITPGTVRAGSTATVSVPEGLATGTSLVVYGPGPLQRAVPVTVRGGQLIAKLPATVSPGDHKIAAYARDGSIIGWTTVTVTRGGVIGPVD